ncbi:MAG: DUF5694 domain-containing protein [Bacteroidota bacterium]
MKSIPYLFLAATLFFSITHISWATPPSSDDPEKVKVLVVGYHYLPHDVMDKNRQNELNALTEQLAHFDADKILLHVPFHSMGEERTNAKYQAYLQGLHPLNRSVQEQLGFRLAEQLGHPRLFGIEDHEALNLAGGLDMIQSEEELEELKTFIQNEQSIESAKQAQSTLGSIAEYFGYLNREDVLEYEHSVLLKGLSQLKEDGKSIGATLLADWYGYHVRLYANLQQVATESGQKVIVLLPSRHLPLFQELLEADPNYEWVSASPYLDIQ